jgi:hypothetical protein
MQKTGFPCRLQPPSSASRLLRPFQLTPSHIAVVAVAFITVVAITAVFIVVQPYGVEWR